MLMKRINIAGNGRVHQHTGNTLEQLGADLTENPSNADYLLLPVPSFTPAGLPAGNVPLDTLLAQLPETATVIGGNLDPVQVNGRRCIDLLRDPIYLAENAAITAECALGILLKELETTLSGSQILILGWGRIGKCLAQKLCALGAEVTVLARKEQDQAILGALGMHRGAPCDLGSGLLRYHAVVNTVPALMIPAEQEKHLRKGCVLLDLASKPGILTPGVLWERGLPGRMAPKSSGRLIAKTVLRVISKKEGLA